jgi:hypothetical protein
LRGASQNQGTPFFPHDGSIEDQSRDAGKKTKPNGWRVPVVESRSRQPRIAGGGEGKENSKVARAHKNTPTHEPEIAVNAERKAGGRRVQEKEAHEREERRVTRRQRKRSEAASAVHVPVERAGWSRRSQRPRALGSIPFCLARLCVAKQKWKTRDLLSERPNGRAGPRESVGRLLSGPKEGVGNKRWCRKVVLLPESSCCLGKIEAVELGEVAKDGGRFFRSGRRRAWRAQTRFLFFRSLVLFLMA